MVGSKVFRKVSLERLSSPEQLDLLMQVTSPRSWLALLGLLSLLISAIIWSVIGRIPIEVNAPAIILPTEGIKSVITLTEGQLNSIVVTPGDIVKEGQVIGAVIPLGHATAVDITSPFDGRVIELKTGVGHLVSAGTVILSLEPAGPEVELEAIMYVPRSEAAQLEPNMLVKLAPQTVQIEEHGYLLGQINTVGEFPVSYEGILSRVGNEDLVVIAQGAEMPIEVKVSLLKQNSGSGYYQWTTSADTRVTVNSGLPASAIIVVGEERPIQMILGE